MFTLKSKNGMKSKYKLPPLKARKKYQSKSKANRRKQMITEDKSIKLRTKKTRLKINSKGSLSKCKTSEWINFSLPTQ